MSRIADRVRSALGLTPSAPHYFFYRHKWPVRVAHWINALCLLVLLMSGLNIFNAHPALYWGNGSNFDHPLLATHAQFDDDGYPVKGITTLFGHAFDTSGWLGMSVEDGERVVRGFPAWATLPAPNWLAMARQWHFAFAWLLVINGAAFFLYGFLSRHFTRDLAPTAQDIRHLPQEITDHARLKFPHDARARHYNALQKLAYCFVLFVLAPLIVLTGLTMSPTMDAAFPILPAIFGGRQTARTIHFVCAFSFLGFFIVHIVMVILSGSWNNLRSMLTGWYVIRKEAPHG
ncbi:MAG TPA: cytochrome b/b6 domain-containing protein [Rhizomicrobium sp.]|nr:cytochrome b/b6 domain-containing protein [Rhizomicrobium sp.]